MPLDIPVPDNPHHFTVGLLGVLLLMMTAGLVYLSRTYAEAKAANQAVNNVGDGDHRLLDMVSHIRDEIGILTEAQADFQEKGWRHLPADIGDATALTLKIRGLEASEAADAEAHAAILVELGRLRDAIS